MDRLRAASNFDFPPGLGRDGVTDPSLLFEAHAGALADRTYTAELVKLASGGIDRGTVHEAGTPDSRRFRIDRQRSAYTDIHLEEDLHFAKTAEGRSRPTRLAVGSLGTFDPGQWISDAVGSLFFEALSLPYAGELTVRTEGDSKVAVFVRESAPARHREVASVDRLALRVDESGLVRGIDARYTPRSRAADPGQAGYDYTLDLGAEPSGELAGRPAYLDRLPTFSGEWRDGGRVLAVTNTGGAPLVGGYDGDLAVENLAVADGAVEMEGLEQLDPGETAYLTGGDRLRLTPSVPGGSRPVLRGDQPPVLTYDFRESYRGRHSFDCDGLDC